MSIESITKFISLIVAVFVVYKGWEGMQASSGKTKKAIEFITISVAILAVLEFLGVTGFDPTQTVLRPLFWYMDIINSLLLLGAVLALRSKK